MFDKFFDKFKKKKDQDALPDADKVTIWDLETGYMLDFDMQTWEVKASYEYDWGNNFFSVEFQLTNGIEDIYLHVEQDDKLYPSIARKIKIADIGQHIRQQILDSDEPPKHLSYKGKTFYRKNESLGRFKDMYDDTWYDFVSWQFADDNEENFVTVERWSENDIEASEGFYAQEYDFSNILPRKI